MTTPVPKTTDILLPKDQYINEVLEKRQIFIHHTASSGNPYGVVEYWESNAERVGTAFLIARGTTTKYKDGELCRCFPSTRAAWHLGLKQRDLDRGKPGNKSSTTLNLGAVGIELCNWGGLTFKDGKYWTYERTTVPEDQVQEYPDKFRGYRFYQKYTTAQLDTLHTVLLYLCDQYDVPKAWKGMEMFDIDKRCLRGEPGIWTHVSVRTDKQDCHPQPELLALLKSL